MTFSQYSRDFYLLRSRNNVLEIDRELLLRNANDPRFQLVEGGGGGLNFFKKINKAVGDKMVLATIGTLIQSQHNLMVSLIFALNIHSV